MEPYTFIASFCKEGLLAKNYITLIWLPPESLAQVFFLIIIKDKNWYFSELKMNC